MNSYCIHVCFSAAYSDFTDVVHLPSPATPILQTRKATVNGESGFSQNLLDVAWWCSPSATCTCAAGANGSLTMKLERFCKLVCNSSMLQDGVRLAAALATCFDKSGRLEQEGARNGRKKENREAIGDKVSGKKESFLSELFFSKVDLHISISKVLLEIAISEKEKEMISYLERNCSSSEEDQPYCSTSLSSKESILVSWDNLTFSSTASSLKPAPLVDVCPLAGGILYVSGLQLLSSSCGGTEFVVPPTKLQVSLSQHLPKSELDK